MSEAAWTFGDVHGLSWSHSDHFYKGLLEMNKVTPGIKTPGKILIK